MNYQAGFDWLGWAAVLSALVFGGVAVARLAENPKYFEDLQEYHDSQRI